MQQHATLLACEYLQHGKPPRPNPGRSARSGSLSERPVVARSRESVTPRPGPATGPIRTVHRRMRGKLGASGSLRVPMGLWRMVSLRVIMTMRLRMGLSPVARRSRLPCIGATAGNHRPALTTGPSQSQASPAYRTCRGYPSPCRPAGRASELAATADPARESSSPKTAAAGRAGSARSARRGLATSSRVCRSARAECRPVLSGASQGSRAGRVRSAAPTDRAARRRSPHLGASPRSRAG